MDNGARLAIGAVGVLAFAAAVADRLDPLRGGLAEGMGQDEFDPRALAKGTVVQLQHTRDPRVASRIARDHLAEHPDYYEALEIMQRRLEREAS